ncbi:MAG TPA: serine/threonine-protein kinase, partial [Polyangiaceae bacterium]|nr:serine/threonine-protein kinase [Polyangiaceae bacterium]
MEAEPGQKISDRVTLVKQLASGSMGVVWIAEHETLKTRVAVKLLHKRFKEAQPSASRRFALEASAAAGISSPYVVRTFDHGVTKDGTQFIVMELLKGENLAERMERDGALPIEDTITIATQTAKALSAAHALELVHRDIKPANIFLTQEHGEIFVKVLDFGVVKQLAGGADAPKLSEPGMLLGTPAYMSRDLVVTSGGQANPQVDLWSLAVVLYRCLTGILPFPGDTASDVLKSIVAVAYQKPSEIRRELGPKVDAWFERAFHREPDKRFRNAEEFASTFRALFAAAPPRKRQPVPLFVGAALVLAGAIAVGSLWSSTPTQSRP